MNKCPSQINNHEHVYAPLDNQCIHCGAKLPDREAAKRVLEWARENLGSHNIYNEKFAEHFTVETGFPANWPRHTIGATKRAISRDPRGGHLTGNDSEKCAYGYEIAEWLADEFAPGVPVEPKMGRGFRMHAALDAVAQVADA